MPLFQHILDPQNGDSADDQVGSRQQGNLERQTTVPRSEGFDLMPGCRNAGNLPAPATSVNKICNAERKPDTEDGFDSSCTAGADLPSGRFYPDH